MPGNPLLLTDASAASPGPFMQAPGIGKADRPNAGAATDPDIVVVAPPVDGTVPTNSGWPWKSLHLSSSLKGVVLSVQTQHESLTQDAPDIVGGLFRAVRDILWPVMETSQQQRENRIVITQIRLRQADGSQRDARLEGRLVGANISLGDEITLWGRYRRGTLLVQRGYNHTSEARILARHASSSSSLLLIISLAVLVIAVYVLTSGFHRFSLWP